MSVALDDHEEIVPKRQKQEGRIQDAHHERPEIAELKEEMQQRVQKALQAILLVSRYCFDIEMQFSPITLL